MNSNPFQDADRKVFTTTPEARLTTNPPPYDPRSLPTYQSKSGAKKLFKTQGKEKPVQNAPNYAKQHSENLRAYRKRMQKYQKIIYLILEEPSSSIVAKLIFILLIAAILVSTGEGLFITKETVFLSFSVLTLDCAIAAIFALEIIFRILSTRAFGQKMRQYVLSPIFIVDLIAVVPIFSEIQYFRIEVIDLKLISLLKITAIFKLLRYIKHTSILVKGITNSLSSLGFLTLVIIINTLAFGILIYYVERNEPDSNFNGGIPNSLWWAIVTMSTVGYGDFIPITVPGKIIASILAIIGMLMLTLPVAILGFHFQEAYNDHQEEIMIENLKGNQFEGRDLDQRAKEIQFLNERIETIEQYNQNIMKALEHSSDIYKKVSRDLRILYKSIYAEAELENKKIVHKNSFSMKLELMERLARTKRKIKLVTVLKAGVGRSKGELSPELPKPKKMADLNKKQNSAACQESEEEESSIFDSLSTDSLNEFSNRDISAGEPSTFVGKVFKFSSKPSLMFKERSKSFDKNIIKAELPERRIVQKRMFSFKDLSQMNSDDILSEQKVQSQSRTPSTILDSKSPESLMTRDITQSNNRLLTAAAYMRRSMEKRSSVLSNSTSPLYNEEFIYRRPSTNVIILNKDPGKPDRSHPSSSSKGYS